MLQFARSALEQSALETAAILSPAQVRLALHCEKATTHTGILLTDSDHVARITDNWKQRSNNLVVRMLAENLPKYS